MNRFRSGLVPLFAVLVLVGCNSEPTGDLRNGPAELVSSPTQLFIELGGIKTVEVGAVDAQGNPLDFNYEVTATGAGINVRRDSSFLPIFVDDTTLRAPAVGPRFRFIVEGTGYTATSFTVSAGGLNVVVPVQVVPQNGLAATFDNPTPALGDTITLTAPAGITFNPDATLTIAGNTLVPLIVSQDATTIRFLAPPNVNSPITVNGVVSAAAPDVVFSPATDTPLQTPFIDTVDVAFSTTTPALNQTVTMTVPEPFINLVVDSLVFPGQLPGREGDPQNIVVAPDSQSLTFSTPPNISGSGTVVNFHFPGDFLIALPTRPSITAPSIGTELNATFSNQTPAAVQPVTLTAPAGFSFDTSVDTLGAPLLAITIGGQLAIINSIAGDGSSVDLLPIPGSAGVASVDGVIPAATPSNIVTMNTVQTVTVPPLTPLEGTDDPATAPTVTVPAVGSSSSSNDAGTFTGADVTGDGGLALAQYYKFNLPADGDITITVDWVNDADIDLVVCDDAGGLDPATCDFAAATGAQPESSTYTLTAGSHFIALVLFDGSPPPFLTVTLER